MSRINPNHHQQRGFLRMLGPTLVAIGGLFTAVGLISFFSAFGSFESPKYFWCAFIGLPLTGLGVKLCKFAYLGKVTRYAAQEVAPVAKDTINYIVDGTRDSVRGTSDSGTQRAGQRQRASIEERIAKLAKMKDSGLINEEDFEVQKDRILSEL